MQPWNQSQRRQIALSVPMIFNSAFPRAIRSIFSSSRWSLPILLSAVPAPRAVTSHHAFSQAICTSSFFCCHQFGGSRSPLLCSPRGSCGDEIQPSEPQQEQNANPCSPCPPAFPVDVAPQFFLRESQSPKKIFPRDSVRKQREM